MGARGDNLLDTKSSYDQTGTFQVVPADILSLSSLERTRSSTDEQEEGLSKSTLTMSTWMLLQGSKRQFVEKVIRLPNLGQ